MTTSSAKPGNLLAYRDGGLTQVAAWEIEVPDLRDALIDLRSALRSLDLPDECDLFVPFHETWFDTLTKSQRHLDEWVGDVADEFIRAAGLDPASFTAEDFPNLTVSADDSQIVVGFADRAESERQARQDAADLAAILGDYGLVHPDLMWSDNDDLRRLVDQYPGLAEILARSERFATDETYGVTLVNTLGPQDVRTMVDLVNTFGFADDADMIEGDAYEGYVVPLAVILGAADRSGRMDADIRDAVLDLDATDEEPVSTYDVVNIDEVYQLEEMRHRSLALLLNAGGDELSAQTTADMANLVLNQAPETLEEQGVIGFVDRDFLQDHRELASNQWAALDALAGNDEAANIFLSKDDNGDGRFGNLDIMEDWTQHDSTLLAADRLGESTDAVALDINQAAGDTIRGGILEHPLLVEATGDREAIAEQGTYGEDTLKLVGQMIELAAGDDMDTSEPVRVALAQVSAPYTEDIAYAAEGDAVNLGESRVPDLRQSTIDGFMQEVSASEGGRLALAQNAAALVRGQMDLAGPLIADGDPDAFGNGSRLSVAYYRELGEAWRTVDVGRVEQHGTLVAAWQSYTDPLVDIVSGKIVDRIPVVNLVDDVPIAGTYIDHVTTDIKESINDSVYSRAIPEPERLPPLEAWADLVGADIRTEIATSLYDNPQTRQDFLDRAAAYPGQDSGAWSSINADGVVELDEFRELEVVKNTVNNRSKDILDGLQAQMAFDEVFRGP